MICPLHAQTHMLSQPVMALDFRLMCLRGSLLGVLPAYGRKPASRTANPRCVRYTDSSNHGRCIALPGAADHVCAFPEKCVIRKTNWRSKKYPRTPVQGVFSMVCDAFNPKACFVAGVRFPPRCGLHPALRGQAGELLIVRHAERHVRVAVLA